jgi:hypothetical protein
LCIYSLKTGSMKKILFFLYFIIIALPLLSQEKGGRVKCAVFYYSQMCKGGAVIDEDKEQENIEKNKIPLVNSEITISSRDNGITYKTQTDSMGYFYVTLPYGVYSVSTNALESLIEPRCRQYLSSRTTDKTFGNNIMEFFLDNIAVTEYEKEYKTLFLLIPTWPCCDPNDNPE